MKITKIESWLVSMRLEEPYTISYETVEVTTNVFLRILTNTHFIGYGCAAPDEYITGETPDFVMKSIRNVVEPMLIGSDPLRSAMLLERIKDVFPSSPSMLAAVDMALLDILGKVGQVPLWKLLGGFRDRIKTSITIGIMPEYETIERAKYWMSQGFKSLKLKGGKNVNEDIVKIIKVRETVGKEIELRFDANQGFSVEETVEFVEKTRSANLELIEQPTPKEQLDLLGNVTNAVHIPVMADESLMTLRDSFRLAKRNLADMVNIKLMKVGGISEALQINSVARSAGLEVMVGCMDEAALAIAAGLAFALARPNVTYADLDGHIGLVNDPSKNAVILRNGILFPTNNPGIGYNMTEKTVSVKL
ncbi:MAG: dipeptide epimerase [Candidatus Schekmanbacteria bacterium RBG_13_48_7]|uniref:Dipeptide epimerase n=1 Tax=Candidatus Schekmanbacteria bacterium RBG_13_48_7 TaxID=1817878 RepID=A0A1F7RUZ1_9BACT|nr:MAG: dipeptide epimerase [Candidatus Schekmanbacteria bacterium RBG_13_48_7]